jgi:hypothetical protein
MPGGIHLQIFLFFGNQVAEFFLGIHPPLPVLQKWSQIGNPLHPAETRNWGLVVLVIILFSITLVTVTARLWARIFVQRNLGWDDGVIIASMVILLFRYIKRMANCLDSNNRISCLYVLGVATLWFQQTCL